MAVSGKGYAYKYRKLDTFISEEPTFSGSYQDIPSRMLYYGDTSFEFLFKGYPNNTVITENESLSFTFNTGSPAVIDQTDQTVAKWDLYVATKETVAGLVAGTIQINDLVSFDSFSITPITSGNGWYTFPDDENIVIPLPDEYVDVLFFQGGSFLMIATTESYQYSYNTWDATNGKSGFFGINCEKTAPLSEVSDPPSGSVLNPDISRECRVITGRENQFGSVALSQYVIQKEVDGNIATETVLLDGTEQEGKEFSFTVGPDFFTGDVTKWRIQLTNTDGLASDWSEWIVWNTKSGASNAEPIKPINEYIEKGQDVEFRWYPGVPLGAVAEQTDLRYSTDGSNWETFAELLTWNTDDVTGEAYYTINTAGFPTGTVYWGVRTWVDGVAGNWSSGLPIIVRGAPNAPTLSEILESPRPKIGWLSTEQVSYEIIADGLFSTGEVVGKSQAYQVMEYYPNGAYAVKIRVKNSAGIWSPWAENTMRINNAGTTSPQAEARFEKLKAVITVANSGSFSKMYVLRNGEPIGKITGSTYTDLAAGGETTSYTVRGVDANDNWTDTTIEVDTRVPAGVVLSSANDLDDSQWFQNRFGEPFTSSESYTDIGEFSSVWGRKYPVYQTAGNADKSVSVNLGIIGSRSKVEWLQGLCGKTCLYRDSMGNRFRGIITGVSDTTQKLSGERYHDISITVRQVEYEETITYDPPAEG